MLDPVRQGSVGPVRRSSPVSTVEVMATVDNGKKQLALTKRQTLTPQLFDAPPARSDGTQERVPSFQRLAHLFWL